MYCGIVEAIDCTSLKSDIQLPQRGIWKMKIWSSLKIEPERVTERSYYLLLYLVGLFATLFFSIPSSKETTVDRKKHWGLKIVPVLWFYFYLWVVLFTVCFCITPVEFLIHLGTGASPGILGPMKRNLIEPLYWPAKKCDAVLYKTMHFNNIFDYHSHISEKKNKDLQPVTVTWSLLIVSLVVPHAGLIYLHNCKYIYEAIWSLRFNPLFSRKINIFLIVLRVVSSHTVCMQQEFSPLFLLQSPLRVPKHWPNILF